jgi:hypothetical protein
MKTLLYFALFASLFLSCKGKEDATPTTPVLKSFITESGVNSRTVKSTYTLVYASDKLSNMQRTDTITENGIKTTSPILNNRLTYEATDNYKLVSDFASGSFGNYTVSQVENTAKKVGNGYEITNTFSSSYQAYASIELNANNQITKYLNTKYVEINQNGIKKETLQSSYIRFEYDANGNVIKVFQKNDNTSPELLTNEYTYDSNPNPYKPLLWVFRMSGFAQTLSVTESNNNILTSKNYSQDTLSTESTSVYTYDTATKYPLSFSSSGKSNNPNTVVGTSKTTYKY